MNCRFRKLKAQNHVLSAAEGSKLKTAFTLIEAVTALAILALISSSVLVVINRCLDSAANSILRMQAFAVARENMEKLLVTDSVSEMAEFGSSDKYPAVEWQTAVETFYEPLTERMWVKAVCSAQYSDAAGQLQSVELTHWLTGLTKNQLLEIMEQKKKEKEQLKDEAKNQPQEPNEPSEPNEPAEPQEQEEQEELICGFTMQELMKMEFAQIWEILTNCDEF